MADGSAAFALGLVSSSTSDPRGLEATFQRFERLSSRGLIVDRQKTRLTRMAYGVKTAARLMGEACQRTKRRWKPAMVTLTYADALSWDAGHISAFLKAVRHYLRRRGERLRYVWVAELQTRGAMHYHVLLWLPKGVTLPKPDKRGWWDHGSTRIEWARRAVGYLAKYASKGETEQGDFPKGARISGVGGLDEPGKVEYRWWRAPSEAREFFGPGVDIRRVNGGRVCRDTGLFWASPWVFCHLAGRPALLRRVDLDQWLGSEQ